MKLFFLLSLLVLSLVHEGTSNQVETCECHEIREEINRLLEPIRLQLDYHFPVPLGFQTKPAVSCKELHEGYPDAPSGYYWIGQSGSPVSVYCDMTGTCGDLTGGWMRVANIDMTNTSQQCPSGFKQTSSPKRVCTLGSSFSTSFSVHQVEYSRVCGRVVGYQYRRPIAFHYTQYINYNNIDNFNYVSGVSLTHGQNPRKHIWTFAGASDEGTSYPSFKCPCINTNISPPSRIPSFVGSDYFCDTALTTYSTSPILYTSDPLWDGEGCGPNNTCCSDPEASVHPPWFIKDLPSLTSEDIEMRFCVTGGAGSTPIERVELYVQ